MITKIAIRNLTEHRSKTFIVGGLIALGASLLVLGNSIMDSVTAGMRSSFTEQYSGDIFIYGPLENEGELSIFGSFGEEGMAPLSQFEQYSDELANQENVKLVSPQTVGMGTLETSLGEQTISAFWGVDPEKWDQSFAQQLTWIEGGLWSGDDSAVALSQGVAEALAEAQGHPMNVGDSVLMTVMGDNGIKIREMTISGVFSFRSIVAPPLEMMSLIDLKTSQALLALDKQSTVEVTLSDSETQILGEVAESDLFGEASMFGDVLDPSDEIVFAQIETVDMAELEAELNSSLARNDKIVSSAVPQYQFAVVLLDDPKALEQTQKNLQFWVDEQGLDWRVGDWQNAAGFIGEMASGIKTILNALVVLITFVSTLIIMNTLVISVTERIQEIGTMRAIGAQKSFVRAMVLAETLILALVSASIGVLLASGVLLVFNMVGIPASNQFLAILFGGDVLYPTVSFLAVGQAILTMTLGALLACLYPLGIALKVSPLKAMQG